MKRKNYVAPECTLYNVQMGSLCEGSYSKNGSVTATSENGGWSKGYAGGIDDDDTPSGGLWDEE